ncbi:2-C-methyl-D-erythritol 2,4-cyclodiphosphate synthase [Bartonella tamiae Th307]|uniref:Bifunctional enzyme IspD/IspF n=2 Tax=Bartonella tamiae TaxID=373638 RepID=J0ZQ35_9HYPH|nr:2-C-methyl-D-erythritol 2,4-cyclodiphosphate synthase [Bartonella tamiae Th239]EJF93895.1 2-C-methyl-D-erythritol 2,4-cyclodiphosphate synthase [Bartonella tamiae Th307]
MLDKHAIIFHTLRSFVKSKLFSTIILVIHRDDKQICYEKLEDFSDRIKIVYGDATRQVSTLNGLRALKDHNPNYVFIHDGVRPFINDHLLHDIIDQLSFDRGVLPALPVSDTLKRSDKNNYVCETISRHHLFYAQTPQAFPYQAILQAHEKAFTENLLTFTDDSAIAEWAGLSVKIMQGDSDNFKITWPEDLIRAKQRVRNEKVLPYETSSNFPDIRTGNGYDVHAFESGESVTLCGVKIPYDRQLKGHSDADVGLHALTDALLATRGAGDIGTHFPPSEQKWKNVASNVFVRHAVNLIKHAHGRIINIDITLIAEEPKIGPHREAMTNALMAMLGISADRISIKATTNEKIGFIGRKEGIAAIATANVIYPGEVPSCL